MAYPGDTSRSLSQPSGLKGATPSWRIWAARSPNDFFNGLLNKRCLYAAPTPARLNCRATSSATSRVVLLKPTS